MDATILPSTTAMSADAVPGQQHHSIVARVGNPGASPSSKRHAAPWPQSAFAESLKNAHVRSPASLLRSQVDAQPQPSRGHKRSATGEIKPAIRHQNHRQFPGNGLNGHLRTASVDSTGNRIAELSAQLRGRLSYAAAKVEQSRQLRRQGDRVSPQTGTSDVRDARQSVQGSHRLHNGFSEDSVVSAPALSQSHISSLKVTNGTTNQARARPAPQPSSMLQTPRLAPPVDITAGDRLRTARRRPNPNEVDGIPSHNSLSRHRRHHSEQEGDTALTSDPRWANTPETSLLTPSQSRLNDQVLAPLLSSNQSPVKRRTPSQNALMEKDAIETLLFMSSPENSGYHSSSRVTKSSVSVSIEAQMAASAHDSSQGSNVSRSNQMGTFDSFNHKVLRTALPAPRAGNHSINLETQAGDEIDRLLDQMEVDRGSDVESRLVSYESDIGASEQFGAYELGDACK
ncbi:hypothetical protein UA08_06683 [Talaromyces atroroseus]|uniref:Uncharacterized protein n=1 Tax=Talaromyces atroroseus TaxID=1441469 RepID=A0A225AII1_TALAT|nr:hypothetical protein UA08_06683 [Talaromyces atroroseus]OKL58054.1 hypothetical protein UA08_06683 [Talaromyces atroroseus]